MGFKKVLFFIVGASILYSSCKEKNKIAEVSEVSSDLNIIYVLADDLGYGDISALNPEGKIQTPNIDELANEGLKFTDAHTSSSVCTPTRYGIITGRYNWRSPLKNGVLTGVSKALIPNDRTTVASLLKAQNYETAFIGKWHLGWDWALKEGDSIGGEGWTPTDYDNIDFTKPISNSPKDLGFTYSFGHSGSLDMAPYVYVENDNVTAQPDKVTISETKYGWWREGPTGVDFVHEETTPLFFEKSINYIKDHANIGKPFFLYLALPSPHTPILPTEEWQGKSGLNPYADFVMLVDDYMGKLNLAIKEAGIEENTLIIFTSDNGCSPAAKIEELQAKNHYPSYKYRGHKADIFEGGHRVPFIVKWPAVIEAGTTTDKIVCTTDLMATCADILNIQLKDNQGEDSYSMLPLFNNDEDKFGREAIVNHSINGSFAIRKGEWKLIFCPGSGGWSSPKPNSEGIEKLPPLQLYNLNKDPKESVNLVYEEPERVTELHALLVKYIEDGRSTPGRIQQNDAPFGGKEWKQIKTIIK
ncbi:arylsulfatase [Joostella atrarenae]|uniref:Arylsulfatase n=1 Tax=Joostella atrarenae TaxID=679257 RepID=A0ABS9J5D0_9FLAO|nr:arylsulfatase [Joostella atrarenae]MCF8715609.1 arylsulfatase [Joostella atrarenae]